MKNNSTILLLSLSLIACTDSGTIPITLISGDTYTLEPDDTPTNTAIPTPTGTLVPIKLSIPTETLTPTWTAIPTVTATFTPTSTVTHTPTVHVVTSTFIPTELPTATFTLESPEYHILWSAGMESGDLSEWPRMSTSGSPDFEISSEYAHSGTYSARIVTYDNHDGVRLRYEDRQTKERTDPENLPNEAYYSAWYYIPQFIEGNNSIMQWKQAVVDEFDANNNPVHQTRKKTFSITLRDMEPHLSGKISQEGFFVPTIINQSSGASVPVGQWFHLEAYYKWHTQQQGAVIAWLDGQEILRLEDYTTQSEHVEWIEYPRQFTVNNYMVSDDGTSPVVIYIDDAAIRIVMP